jgi:molecular chaperone HtpG
MVLLTEYRANKDKIAKLLRFATNKSDNATQTATLECYVKSMQKDQKTIYYITAETYESAKGSPHLEVFNKKDIEVLLLSDRVDQWMVSNFGEFEGVFLHTLDIAFKGGCLCCIITFVGGKTQ